MEKGRPLKTAPLFLQVTLGSTGAGSPLNPSTGAYREHGGSAPVERPGSRRGREEGSRRELPATLRHLLPRRYPWAGQLSSRSGNYMDPLGRQEGHGY